MSKMGLQVMTRALPVTPTRLTMPMPISNGVHFHSEN